MSAKDTAASERRLVHFNSERAAEHKFCSNKITTSLYHWHNCYILPFDEFIRKGANLYFVIVSILQCLPPTSNTNGIPTTLPALLVVVALNIFFKLHEDAARKRADRLANNSPCRRLEGATFVDSVWTDVQVGDFLQITNHESMPADVLLIAGHEPEPENPRGGCHVETKQLDGETNLKGKSVPSMLTNLLGAGLQSQTQRLGNLKGYVDCETPNPQTNKFVGVLHVEGHEAVPIGVNNVLLRGSSLRNTEYVVGLVINTGSDTKVMQGARKPPQKQSSIEKSINKLMTCVALTLFFMCLLSAGLSMGFNSINGEREWYLQLDQRPASQENALLVFLYFFVLLASFVSVTLYVSITFCKISSAWFMSQSIDTYDPTCDTALKVRSSPLTDELGLVSHIFSDKTGTLTQNIMQFRKCSINGVNYGRGTTEIGLARLRRLGETPQAELDEMSRKLEEGGGGTSAAGGTSLVNFDGPELLRDIESGGSQGDVCRDFFLKLALCHTVVTEILDGEKRLSASSPDEAALVAAAKHFGYDFVDRQQDTVKVFDARAKTELQYEVLDVLEFSSARRRMSVVVRQASTGAVSLITKGADSVMMKLLAGGGELVKRTEEQMIGHSEDGLRTLVLAAKDLTAEAYASWSDRYRKATLSTAELEKKARDEPNDIDRLCDEIEVGLTLLGSTAIEDKLQVGTPKCIADLGRGGISLWVLTGDKEETAINIAFACQLLDLQTKITVINGKTHPTKAKIVEELNQVASSSADDSQKGFLKRALVIDGEALDTVLKVGDSGEALGCQLAFLKCTQMCHSVVACRCAPSQKAQLVQLAKRNVKGAVTLAIGDGANDVAMIQAAHVGVGISGQEGMQAANSADFAISQFRFLRDLLLVAGRNNYRRQATLTCYIFYKNVMMVLTVWWFNFFCGYSGQKWNLEVGYQMFNAFFTLFPIMWITCFDKDVSDETSRRLPQLYHLGIRKEYYGWTTCAKWFCQAVYESLVITLLCIFSLEAMAIDGEDPGLFYVGSHTFTLTIIVANLKLFLWQWRPSWYSVVIIFLELALWWMACGVCSVLTPGGMMNTFVIGWFGMWEHAQLRWAFWFLMLLIPAAVLMPQMLFSAWRRQFYPKLRDLAMECEKHGLDAEMKALEKWDIPLAERKLPLHKDAPRPDQKPGCVERVTSCIRLGLGCG